MHNNLSSKHPHKSTTSINNTLRRRGEMMNTLFLMFVEFWGNIKKETINNNSRTTIQPTVSGIGKVVNSPSDYQKATVIKKEIKHMYNFGKRSKSRLDTCHEDIVKVLEATIKVHDFSVLEGLRTAEKQAEYFRDGKSQLDGVNRKSKHQDDGSGKSKAVDIMPYYKGFNAFTSENGAKSFYYLAGLVQGIAQKLYDAGEIKHELRWGGNWDSDMDFFSDSTFFDLPHFELIKPKK